MRPFYSLLSSPIKAQLYLFLCVDATTAPTYKSGGWRRNDGYDDLNPAHVSLFRYEGLDGRRPTQLAEFMQITKQSVNDLLRHLERCGYTECRRDPKDKRARLVCLTARGRRLEAAVRKYARAAEGELANELGQERFREFHRTLRKISGLPG